MFWLQYVYSNSQKLNKKCKLKFKYRATNMIQNKYPRLTRMGYGYWMTMEGLFPKKTLIEKSKSICHKYMSIRENNNPTVRE